MSRSEAKAKLVKLVDETIAALPVAGWEVVQSPYEEDCSVDGGAVMYVYGKKGGAGRDPEADAKTIAALWKKHGLKAVISHSGGTAHEPVVDGQGGPVRRIEFLANRTGYAVDGVSHCVP